MPTNQIKKYNQLLDFLHSSLTKNLESIRKVFDRDFVVLPQIVFNGLPVEPTKADGEDTMERQFRHLTTVITDEKTRKREFETSRTVRLHWIRFLLLECSDILVFKVDGEKVVYVLDKSERYVIILEPKRDTTAFQLLTAYLLEPSRFRGIMRKFERRGTLL